MIKKFTLIALIIAAVVMPGKADAWYHGGFYGPRVGIYVGGAYPYYPAYPYPYASPYYTYAAPVPVAAAPAPVAYQPTYQQAAAPATSNGYCREFTQKVRINGNLQNTYGTACQQPDGTWKVVDQQ